MKKQPNFFLPAIQKKYLKHYGRFQRAVRSGRFALYAVEKKQQLMQCLARYEKQLRICGKGIAVGAALLLPSVGIFAQPVPEGGEFQVDSNSDSRRSSVALDSSGDFVIVWAGYYNNDQGFNIYAQQYNNAGVEEGIQFQVNTYTTNSQSYPSVAMDNDGDFVISWSSVGQDGSSSGIYAQRYNNLGIAQGNEFLVNSSTLNNQGYSSVAMDNDGNFVVTWSSYGQDGSSYGVYAQRYNNIGLEQGSEFQVNSYSSDAQLQSSVAMDNDGNFVITWSSYGQDGSSYGIYAKRYSNLGASQGDEFLVNTYTLGSQNNGYSHGSRVAMDIDGDFVITWQSHGQVTGTWNFIDIYAQRYNNAGAAIGDEFKVFTTSLSHLMPSVKMDSDGNFIIIGEISGDDEVYARYFTNNGIAICQEFKVNSDPILSYQSYPSIDMNTLGEFVITWTNFYDIFAQRYSSIVIPPEDWYPDTDQDGYGAGLVISDCIAPVGYIDNDLDCNDNDDDIHPEATEICGNNIDDDCDGLADANDSDFINSNCFLPSALSTSDITEFSASADWSSNGCAFSYIFHYKRKVDPIWNSLTLGDNAVNYILENLLPGTKYQWRITAVCNTSGSLNSDPSPVQNFTTKYRVYPDTDLDGYGNSAASSVLVATFPLTGYSLNNSDCNDSNNAINPGVAEICNNNLDDDCDGLTDGSDPDIFVSTWYQDSDGDGKGNPAVSQVACGQPVGYVANNLDCDDSNVAVCPMPGLPVTSAIIDVSAMASWNGTSCAQRYTFQYKKKVDAVWIYVPLSSNMTSFLFQNLLPGTKYQWRVTTVCDTFSNVVSSPVPVQNFTTKYRVYPDVDGDGYGNLLSAAVFVNSLPAPGYAVNNFDCNDSNSAIFPGGTEICNLEDDDCDGLSDEGFPVQTYHQDLDDDGYGNMAVTIQACTVPTGYVSNSTDCNDTNTNISPNALEICNSGTDDDCDGLADDLDPGITGQTTWYIDSDGDGLGSATTTILTCVPPMGYVGNALDCNDTSSSPICLAPSNLSVSGITSNTATLSWVNSPCVSNYVVQYRPNATGSWLPAPPFLVNGNSHLFTGLTPNTLYQYRIRDSCSAINVNTPFITGTFTTLPMPLALSGTGTTGAGYADFELYPNPGDGVFNLRMESVTEGSATVMILDGLGKMVYSTSWSLSKGLNITKFDLSAMANGVYEVQVRDGEMVKNKKLVMVR